MRKKQFCILILMMLTSLLCNAATWEVPNERLTYDVMYKWGLINKKAGSVALTTTVKPSQKQFRAKLTGATAPWADKFYKVRDTLSGTIDKADFLPTYYEKIANEGGDYSRDILTYTRSGNTVTADVKVWRKKKKATETTHDQKRHSATGTTLDMLSSFYYMRQLNFPNMKKGESVKLNVFSGRQKEILTIYFQGIEEIDVKKKKYQTYHITFTFTSSNGTKTSDNMDAWISTHQTRIPLLLEGKLPVGKVRCFYSGTIPTDE